MLNKLTNVFLKSIIIGLFFILPLIFLITEYLFNFENSIYITIISTFILTAISVKKFKQNITIKFTKWQFLITFLLLFVPKIFWNIQNGWIDNEGYFYSESDRTQHVSYVNQLLISKELPINEPYMSDKKVIYSLSTELFVAFVSKAFGLKPYNIFQILYPFIFLFFLILVLNIFASISKSKKMFILFLAFSGIMINMASFGGWVSWTIGHITLLWLINLLIQNKKTDKSIGFLNGVMSFQYLPITIIFSFVHFIYKLKNKMFRQSINFVLITALVSIPSIIMFFSSELGNYASNVNEINAEILFRFAFFCFIVFYLFIICLKKNSETNYSYLALFSVWGILSLFKTHWISISITLLIGANVLAIILNKKNKFAEYSMIAVLLEICYLLLGTKMFYAIKIERIIAFIMIVGIAELLKNNWNNKATKLFVIAIMIIGFYHFYNYSKYTINSFINMDFTENKVSKWDVMAYNWINKNDIEGKTFIVSYYNNFVFCPLSALTKNKMFYCSKMIAITQGYNYLDKVKIIEKIKTNPETLMQIKDVDYLFISSDNLYDYGKVIDYCANENNSCKIVYSKLTTIIQIK